MPPVIAAIGAVVATVGAAATAVVGAIGLTGVASALGMSAFSFLATTITVGASLLRGGGKSSAPTNSKENLNRLRANVDVRTPRKTMVGTSAMATDIRDEEITGTDQDYFHRFIVVASHKVHAIKSIWFDDRQAWNTTDGVLAPFVGYLTVTPILEGNAGNAINISSRMGTTRRYTGCAYVHLRYKLTGNDTKVDSPFAQSITTRITIKGEGAYFYDPRKDSTVAGGSGAHRADDQSTWEWDDEACTNPALALLFYLLGWKINGELAVGKGIPANRIDLESFITAANICEESVWASIWYENRYAIGGVWSEGDSPTTVMDMLKASMNADLDDVDGKLRLTIFTDDTATPDAEFTADDVLGAFEWVQSPTLDQSFNIVRGVYTNPTNESLYQPSDYPQVAEASPDGIDRIMTLNLPMVESAYQAQRLAALRLTRQQFGGVFKAEFQATAWKVQKNSIVTLTFPPLGFVDKVFRVAEMELRVDGTVPLVLVEEDPAIYDAPTLIDPVEAVEPTPYDPFKAPIIDMLDAVEPGATRNVSQGPWAGSTDYIVGDIVSYDGASYTCITAHTSSGGSPPPNANFDVLVEAGAPGADGLSALAVTLSSEAAIVPTDADGNGGDFSTAMGQMTVWYGDTDVTASATLSEVSETACTGTINTATNTPVGSQPKGYYRVTAITADAASYVMRASYTPPGGSAIVVDRTFTVSRAKRQATMSVTQDRREITYDSAGALDPSTQTTEFTATKTGTTATVAWTVFDLDGVARTPTTTYLSGATGDVVTMTAAQFDAARNGTEGVIINANLGSGMVIQGLSLIRSLAGADGTPAFTLALSNDAVAIPTDGDGNNGDFSGANGQVTAWYGDTDVTASTTFSEVSETNCTGTVNTATDTPVSGQAKGYYRLTAISDDVASYVIGASYDPGSGALTAQKVFSASRVKKQPRMWITQDRDDITTDWDGTANPGTQTTEFTATKVDSAATVTWYVFDLDGNAKTPTSTYLSSATGDSVTMTAAQFASAIGSTEGVVINAVLGSSLVTVGTGLMRKKSARPAKSWQVAPNKVTVHTDSTGTPDDPASNILTATSNNTTGVTYTWTLFDGAGTAKTPLATYATMSGTGNSVLTITNANMLTAAGSTGSLRVVCTPSDTDLAPITTTLTEVGDGASAVSTEIYGTRDRVTRDAWGRIWPSSQTTDLSLTRKNFTGGTVAWTITDGDGNTLTPATYLSATSGDTTSITAANVSAGAGATRRVIIYATVNSLVTAYPIVLDTVGPIGGNEFPDPQFNAGTTAWAAQPVAPFSLQTNGVTNGYKYENYIRSTSTTTAETYLVIAEKIPVRYSGEKFWFGFSGGNVGAGTMPQGAFVRFRNLAGTLVGSTTTLTTSAAITLSSDWPQIISSAIIAPSTAAYIEIGAYRAGIGAISSTLGYSTQFFLQRNEPGSDITSTAFPAIAPQLYASSPSITLPAGWKGDAASSFIMKFTRIYGTTDVSSSATWTAVQAHGCSVSVASDGTATVTRSSDWEYGAAFFRVKSAYLGVEEYQTVKILLDMAAPPQPFTDSKILIGSPASTSVTATAYATEQVIWGPHSINSMTAGVIAGIVIFHAEANAFGGGSASINIKGQYRAVGGGSWVDMGLNTSKSLGQLNSDGTSKVAIGATWGVASGLTNSTDYEFRIIAYKTTATSVTVTPRLVYLNSGVQL